MNDTWWKFVVLGLVIVGLLFWRRGQQEEQPTADLVNDAQIEQQVNELLEQTNIQLPEGSERVNLRPADGVAATGVVSLSSDDAGSTEVAVVASLPDELQQTYSAWLTGADVEPVSLGTLRLAKGGYVLDTSTSVDLSMYDDVVVSEGMAVADNPLLSGSLPESEGAEEE